MTDDEKKLIGIDRELLDITTRAEAIRDAAIESGDADDGIVEVLAIDIWRAVDRIRECLDRIESEDDWCDADREKVAREFYRTLSGIFGAVQS